MSKFIPGNKYVSVNNDKFIMKVESRGTKYLSGIIYLTVTSREWDHKQKKAKLTTKVHKYPFDKAKFQHYEDRDRDSIWFSMDEDSGAYPLPRMRVGFESD